jgi:hypothetical protein
LDRNSSNYQCIPKLPSGGHPLLLSVAHLSSTGISGLTPEVSSNLTNLAVHGSDLYPLTVDHFALVLRPFPSLKCFVLLGVHLSVVSSNLDKVEKIWA